MGVPDNLTFEQQINVIIKTITKTGGPGLARMLWEDWGCQGSFDVFFKNRIADLLNKININHSANARIRAFKSSYWAHRWTSVNLSFFSAAKPISVPYYNDKICRFICTVPERLLYRRKIQIEYIKMNAPDLAKISWQQHRPFNLYNYSFNKLPWNIPFRLLNKGGNLIKGLLGQEHVQRNWELQFLGRKNQEKFKEALFTKNIVPKKTISNYWNLFTKINQKEYAHPISMLLTLSKFR